MNGGTPVVVNAQAGPAPSAGSGKLRFIIVTTRRPGATNWRPVVNGTPRGAPAAVPGTYARAVGNYEIAFKVNAGVPPKNAAGVKVFQKTPQDARDVSFVYLSYT